ncbi:LuxR C-terminal-related transcriptional regulator [Serratia ficaria]|jgi:two-component system capsular synthesis response regulator RcsB|uniref:Capsular synthesis regulator component B n=1 Tax=Serratia ficaria TaxID=61651 RepID=A0A240C9U5_SERFI|nr:MULTISPECIES: LuxR C-terminal-related transcriptional regulator [Serratia]MEE4484855.1 LuxR C-terminal-related transcriptional regulator [Serratia ficaria]REF43297.1 two-component system capsular synthesis response regulator RcsB [Serratia ficaria]CAI0700663.1 Capsular synthesis regulator component B [Serratia ficaria]CAI1063501.1 Capsular synthesis regulator component B [Serratia ficaria]CAI1111230.1 Capsular synthesis regulator component B [Serratia ficaria]
MHFLRHQRLNIALMDRCPLTLDGLASFMGTLSTPGRIVVQETSMGEVAEGIIYQRAEVLIAELCGVDETAAQGRDILLNLCAQLPALSAVVYTRSQSAETLGPLLSQPRISIVARDDPLPLVAEFFNRVLSGERVLSPQIGACLARTAGGETAFMRELTRCESDVLVSLFNGMSLRQIAELQRRSIKTISAHKCSAMRKLQVTNDSELFSLHGKIARQFAGEWPQGSRRHE